MPYLSLSSSRLRNYEQPFLWGFVPRMSWFLWIENYKRGGTRGDRWRNEGRKGGWRLKSSCVFNRISGHTQISSVSKSVHSVFSIREKSVQFCKWAITSCRVIVGISSSLNNGWLILSVRTICRWKTPVIFTWADEGKVKARDWPAVADEVGLKTPSVGDRLSAVVGVKVGDADNVWPNVDVPNALVGWGWSVCCCCWLPNCEVANAPVAWGWSVCCCCCRCCCWLLLLLNCAKGLLDPVGWGCWKPVIVLVWNGAKPVNWDCCGIPVICAWRFWPKPPNCWYGLLACCW